MAAPRYSRFAAKPVTRRRRRIVHVDGRARIRGVDRIQIPPAYHRVKQAIHAAQKPATLAEGKLIYHAGDVDHPAPSAQFDLTSVPKIVHPAPPPPAPVNTEDPYDPTMPSYSITSEVATRQLTQYCTGMYNPVDPLLTQEQNKFKYANRAAKGASLSELL